MTGRKPLDGFSPDVVDPVMNPFTQWIKRAGLLKSEVARAMGVRDPAIGKYSRAGFWPTKHVALRIVRLTGGEVTPNDLLGRVAVKNNQEHRRILAIQKARLKDSTAKTARNAAIYKRWRKVKNLSQVAREVHLSVEQVRKIVNKERGDGKAKKLRGRTKGGQSSNQRHQRRTKSDPVHGRDREIGEVDHTQGRGRGDDPQPAQADES